MRDLIRQAITHEIDETTLMAALHYPPETAGMESLRARYDSGLTFEAMLESATESVEMYRNFRERAIVPPEFPARIAATQGRWHLLVISEDWCGDSVNIVPWIDALASSSAETEMRIIGRDDDLDLMDRHLTNGRSRSIPIVLLLDERFFERAWWGPRPSALQEWFTTAEAQALPKAERYKALRLRYARDRGRTIMEELTAMIEDAAARAAAQEGSAPSVIARAAT